MKVVLDENLDHRLRLALREHEVFTVSYLGWSGLKNGALLKAAEDLGFDVLLTGDQTLSDEQNLGSRRIAVVVLSSIEWRIIKDHLASVANSISEAAPGTVSRVECGQFSRKPDAS